MKNEIVKVQKIENELGGIF